MKLHDSYYIQRIGVEKSEELEEFLMNHFLFEEPLNRASGMSRDAFGQFVKNLFARTLNVPFSFAVFEKDTNKMVGCSMSSIWNRSSESHEESGEEFAFGEANPKIDAVGRILTNLHAQFFELKPDVHSVLHLEILSVAKDHQRRGIASCLMEMQENVEEIQKMGASGIASEISSLANQHLMKKRGYETLTFTLLSSELDVDNQPLLITDDGTDRVDLVYKQFI